MEFSTDELIVVLIVVGLALHWLRQDGGESPSGDGGRPGGRQDSELEPEKANVDASDGVNEYGELE